MPFSRHLDDAFVRELNRLYKEKTTWWNKLADDPNVFIAIRNNSLNAYVYGGSIGKITWHKPSVALTVHRAYLVFPGGAGENPYTNLLDPGTAPKAIVIKDIDDYVKHFPQIKRAVKLLTGSERWGANKIAKKLGAVVDVEAAFSAEAKSTNSEFEDAGLGPGRVDLVAVAEGRIVCTEAKLFVNGELRSTPVPAVCSQLISYHRWLKRNAKPIQSAYKNVCGYYGRLKGNFFEQRLSAAGGKLSVDLIPRLLIFGFDRQQRGSLGKMKKRIKDGVGNQIPGFEIEHIRAVGKPQNVNTDHIL